MQVSDSGEITLNLRNGILAANAIVLKLGSDLSNFENEDRHELRTAIDRFYKNVSRNERAVQRDNIQVQSNDCIEVHNGNAKILMSAGAIILGVIGMAEKENSFGWRSVGGLVLTSGGLYTLIITLVAKYKASYTMRPLLRDERQNEQEQSFEDQYDNLHDIARKLIRLYEENNLISDVLLIKTYRTFQVAIELASMVDESSSLKMKANNIVDYLKDYMALKSTDTHTITSETLGKDVTALELLESIQENMRGIESHKPSRDIYKKINYIASWSRESGAAQHMLEAGGMPYYVR